jgi:cytochrome c-type biogenesis protein CcsB
VSAVSINTGLAQLSNDLLLLAIVTYSLSLLAFAGDFAYGRPRRRGEAAGKQQGRQAAVPELAGIGAAGSAAAGSAAGGAAPGAKEGQPPSAVPGPPASGASTASASSPAAAAAAPGGRPAPGSASPALRDAGLWVRAAVTLAAVGLAAHVLNVVTRGLAVHRVPWGNMYEFVVAISCMAVLFFFTVMIRYRAWYLGMFVMGSVVVVLGLAETVIYTPAGELVPALQSYWLAIHVTAMTVATGVFFVAAVMGTVYLFAERHARLVGAGRATAGQGIMGRLPGPAVLDRLAYRTVVFGFPIWTFGVIAGAIWADQAWGRYWGWDPVETWAFITWVVYAAFLHARATAGWRGKRAAYIQLLGFGCLVFNVLVVQVFITGLHSYAGLPG